jgi:hypothetical protein
MEVKKYVPRWWEGCAEKPNTAAKEIHPSINPIEFIPPPPRSVSRCHPTSALFFWLRLVLLSRRPSKEREGGEAKTVDVGACF